MANWIIKQFLLQANLCKLQCAFLKGKLKHRDHFLESFMFKTCGYIMTLYSIISIIYSTIFCSKDEYNEGHILFSLHMPCHVSLFYLWARHLNGLRTKRRHRHVLNSTCKRLSRLYSSEPGWKLVDSYPLEKAVEQQTCVYQGQSILCCQVSILKRILRL